MHLETRHAAASAALLPMTASGLRLTLSGTAVLDGVDLTLPGGECTALMGPNGAGKSVLLRVLHGLWTPDAGAVRWGGRPPSPRLRRRQAMVFQRPVMLRRSVAANVAYPLRVHGVSRRERRERVAAELERAGLTDLARRPAPALSGGERQRLAIARALATHPEVLLLDEPTANLDPAAAHGVERLISAARANGVTVVLTTHDTGQARRLGEAVVFLHRGRVAEHTPAETFFAQPRSAAAEAYMAGRLLVTDPRPPMEDIA